MAAANPEQVFVTLRLRDKNLRPAKQPDWKEEEEIEFEQMLERFERTGIMSRFGEGSLDLSQKVALARVTKFLVSLCRGDGRLYHTDAETELKGRLMGA